MAKSAKTPEKKPVPKKEKLQTPEDKAEEFLGGLSGTAHKVAVWSVSAVFKELLPEGYDPQLRAAAYFPAHSAAYLSAYIVLSKNKADLDSARFQARASAKGVVLAVTDPVLHPEPAPLGLRLM